MNANCATDLHQGGARRYCAALYGAVYVLGNVNLIRTAGAMMNYAQRMHSVEAEILTGIPISRTMQLKVLSYDGERLSLKAPLDPNINDKGCAFGGSLASAMTLSCWALARCAMQDADLDADIYVQDSSIDYLLPVWGEIVACAHVGDARSLADFINMFRARSKARLQLYASVWENGQEAARLSARFVAKARIKEIK